VLTTWQSRFTDIHAENAVADGNRLARARLDRRLDQWRKRYPELDVEAVAVHGSTVNYLTKNAGSIKLLVVGHERASGIREIVGPPGYAALHHTDCSVLICEPRNVL
jgi:nucleotide-binding universal stress UspA family protein